MSGGRITQAIESLTLFLKSLPENSIYNIISFGTDFKRLYPHSVNYTDENLTETI